MAGCRGWDGVARDTHGHDYDDRKEGLDGTHVYLLRLLTEAMPLGTLFRAGLKCDGHVKMPVHLVWSVPRFTHLCVHSYFDPQSPRVSSPPFSSFGSLLRPGSHKMWTPTTPSLSNSLNEFQCVDFGPL